MLGIPRWQGISVFEEPLLEATSNVLEESLQREISWVVSRNSRVLFVALKVGQTCVWDSCLILAPDIQSIPLPVLLGPFFAIIRSPISTGPITSAALSALHNFFVCGLISAKSVKVEIALVELSSAVSHCKFEASDSSGDEVVLLKIMTVIHDYMVGSSLGIFLGDVEICEMLETVLTTCCQMRLSGL
jgi:hypothetical protein